MSKQLPSYIEVYIPEARYKDNTTQLLLESVVQLTGGATVTKAEGVYIRKDGLGIDDELVYIVHWDFPADDYLKVRKAVHFLVDHMFEQGEEAVLRKRMHFNHYKAELLFSPAKVEYVHQPPLPLHPTTQ